MAKTSSGRSYFHFLKIFVHTSSLFIVLDVATVTFFLHGELSKLKIFVFYNFPKQFSVTL